MDSNFINMARLLLINDYKQCNFRLYSTDIYIWIVQICIQLVCTSTHSVLEHSTSFQHHHSGFRKKRDWKTKYEIKSRQKYPDALISNSSLVPKFMFSSKFNWTFILFLSSNKNSRFGVPTRFTSDVIFFDSDSLSVVVSTLHV